MLLVQILQQRKVLSDRIYHLNNFVNVARYSATVIQTTREEEQKVS